MGIIANTTRLFLAGIFKQSIFFFKSYFKNANVFTFCNFKPNCIEKKNYFSFGKVVFQILVTWLFRETQIPFWLPFWNEWFVDWVFCWYMVVLGVYTCGASFVPKFLRKNTQKWMSPSRPVLCTNRSEKWLTQLSVHILFT